MAVTATKQEASTDKTKKSKSTYHEKRRLLGQRGEEIACEFLVRHDMKIVDRNWRCSYGEADVIALDGRTLVFCEVKTRKGTGYGSPVEAVTFKKRQRYYKLIGLYRRRCKVPHSSVRFDVIGILVDEARKKAKLQYVRDAYANC
ncbi:MAG: YraN family protein [Coriobacteriia bacterium]|nr:YraN family protein [Coriobacteriia bacterium]